MSKPITDHLGHIYKNTQEMCNAYNINSTTFRSRLQKNWSLEKALTTPTKQHDIRVIKEDHLGHVYDSMQKMCDAYNIHIETFRSRILKKWDLEKALTTPTAQFTRISATDHNGKKFNSVQNMCEHYNVTYERFDARRRLGFKLIECLNIIPLINTKIRNKIINNNLTILYCTNPEQQLDKLLFKCDYKNQKIIATRNTILTYCENTLT